MTESLMPVVVIVKTSPSLAYVTVGVAANASVRSAKLISLKINYGALLRSSGRDRHLAVRLVTKFDE